MKKNEFKAEYTIGFFGCDNFLKLTPTSIAVYFQELAIAHSDSLGYTIEVLSEAKKGWAITNWHISVLRYPHKGEKIKIITWPNDCKRMQAQRSFRVEDESGSIICLAMSRWIFMDLERRRPSPFMDGMDTAYACDKTAAIPQEKYGMPKGQPENLYSEREFTVRRRDTDTNGHANNTKYIEWAIDDVPDEIYDSCEPMDIRVVYRKECYKGSQIISRCYLREENGEKELISYFLDKEKPSVVFAEVATLWKTRH